MPWLFVITMLWGLISTSIYSITRTKNLPEGFQWCYMMDTPEMHPRSGNFWRDAVFMNNKIIVLNTYDLVALDYKGNPMWIKGLPSENPHAEAKIHVISPTEIVVIITDGLMLINTENGELINHYKYDVLHRSSFQKTQLLPRHSIFFNNNIYVFLGAQLLCFDPKTFKRKVVRTFNSLPKILPMNFQNQFLLLGFYNGFLELFNPITKKHKTILQGAPDRNFSIKQPVIIQDKMIFIPSNKDILVYHGNDIFVQSSFFKNAILSSINDSIWVREHKTGMLVEIDNTLSPLKKLYYTPKKTASLINTPLTGYHNKMIHIDGINGKIFVITNDDTLSVKKIILTEDFIDNPPVQSLAQKNELVLIGGFDGLYLINLKSI